MIITTLMKTTVVCGDEGNRVAAAISSDVHDNDDPETMLAMTAMAIGCVGDGDGAAASAVVVVVVVVVVLDDDDDDVRELL